MSVVFCLAALALAVVGVSQTPPKNYSPTKWTVFGPYPNPPLAVATAEGVLREGFDKEFDGLETGEPKSEGKPIEVKPGDAVDFAAIFVKDTDNKVAYAHGVIESDSDQVLNASFGSDDAAKIWVNGKLVHRMWTSGRGLEPGSDLFTVPVQKGANSILVKIDNVSGGWGFLLNLYDDAGMKAIQWRNEAENLGDRPFASGYLFIAVDFPKLDWRDRLLLEPLLSPEPPKVRWFDADANEVTIAEKLGLYCAYIEAKTATGATVRKLLPFCRMSPDATDPVWIQQITPAEMPLTKQKPDWLPLPSSEWEQNRAAFGRFVTGAAVNSFVNETSGAAIAGYMATANKPAITRPMDLDIWLADYLLKVRRKIDGFAGSPLATPKKRSSPAPEIRYGTLAEAGMKPDTVAKLKPMLEAWSKEEGKPFTAVFARHGVVFLHEGFGTLMGKPTPKDALFYPASIGKTLFGSVFAQFVDQGLVNPDDPIGKYLKDFPTTGDKAVTFRNCVTHTSGISGHFTHGGFWNPTLDNSFSLRLPNLDPGVRFAYGGDGNNLASIALELISGVPTAKLLRQNLFDPLGAASIVEPDLGFASEATAWDIAKVGQMLANHGAYGNWQFFSEETFQKFLPTRLAPLMPRLSDPNLEWGFAVQYITDPDGPREKSALGPNVIGHGSASSSIFRVDLDSGVVVVMGRYGIGNEAKYNEYREKVMRLIRESIVK